MRFPKRLWLTSLKPRKSNLGIKGGTVFSPFFIFNIYAKLKTMFKYHNVLLTSEDKVKEISPIDPNLAGENLYKALQTAQDMCLEPVIGTALLRRLQELVGTGEIANEENANYKYLLDNYIWKYLAARTVEDLIPSISIKIANIGTVKANDEKLTNISEDEMDALQDRATNIADFYGKSMCDFLKCHSEDYAELNAYDGEGLPPVLYSSATTGVWLGGARNPQMRIINRKKCR